MKLSIGQAWDETKEILRRDGSAIATIALALVVLPGAVLETVSPTPTRAAEATVWLSLAGLITALLSLVGQLAIARIAVGPSTTVGKALGHSFRRVPALFGALLLMVLPFVLVISVATLSSGGDLTTPQQLSQGVAILLIVIFLIGIFVFLRQMFLTPLAVDSSLGSIGLLREGWGLTRGRVLKLLLLLLLLALVGLVLVAGLGGALSAVIVLALGSVTPGSISAVLVALVQGLLAAIVSALFVVVVCRLYVQAKNGSVQASVPHAGGE